MAVIATDNFMRTSPTTLGPNWTNLYGSSWGILSNTAQVITNASGNDNFTIWSANSFPNDQYAQTTIATIGGGDRTIGPCIRNGGSGSVYYAFAYLPIARLYLAKIVSGAQTNITFVSYTAVTGDVIYIEARGTTVKVAINGVTEITQTDSSISSGSAGMYGGALNATNASTSLWTGGNFISGVQHFLPILGVGA